jgi:glycosyltransferase involved in cell wall biosynthesis
MKQKPTIAYLTSGAAGMYCGSCMHDNSLARALQGIGWDVQLIPTYTPIRTDEKNVTIDHVFFGGINVYLQQKIPVFRHIPAMLDRFFDNPWLIRKMTANASETSPKLLGSLTVSMLQGIHGNQRKEVKRLVSWLKKEVKPDALLLSNILIAGFVPYFKQELNVPVVVTLQGDDIFLDSLPANFEKQAVDEIRKIGNQIDAFIYHSQFYADKMNQWFNLDPAKTKITPLAIDSADFQDEPKPSDRISAIPESHFSIGYLARIAPEKGLHLLVDAFIQIKQNATADSAAKNAQLLVAGWLGSHNETYADDQFAKIESAGLQDDYHFLGTIDRNEKIEFLKRIDLFCVPTSYAEPKGLYVLEALANGIAVVQPKHGAFPEMIESTGGGVLFEPENVTDLASQLEALINDAGHRKKLAETGRNNVLAHRNPSSMARDTASVFESLFANVD